MLNLKQHSAYDKDALRSIKQLDEEIRTIEMKIQTDIDNGLKKKVARLLTVNGIASGKLKKVALTACMRKLLITLNVIVKHRSEWQPDFGCLA